MGKTSKISTTGAGLGLALSTLLGCNSAPPAPDDAVGVGLMLSYTHYLAANSINTERAVLMAIENANAGVGQGGRRLEVLPRDTQSQADKVVAAAQELVAANVAVIIGPETADTVTPLRTLFEDRTMIFPSYSTSSDLGFGSKSPSWFVMGAFASQVACEIHAQIVADGHKNPLLIANPTGYGSTLGWQFQTGMGLPKYVLPTDQPSTASSVQPIMAYGADSYILVAFPSSASALVSALSAVGALNDPSRWYLAPTLHTPVFLSFVPTGSLDGARGVSPGTMAGASDFREAFLARWQDEPLDEAYAFYDAAMVAALAIERAVLREGTVPTGMGLSTHIRAVTAAGKTPVQWNDFARAFELLAQGQEVEYIGLSGLLEFDSRGLTPSAQTKWWAIGSGGFADVQKRSDCK